MVVVLKIQQGTRKDDRYEIALTLNRPGQADLTGKATIDYALSEGEREDIRWYLEDYLVRR